jgi:hypothetical protein
MTDREEARLRYLRQMQAHIITPEEERRCAELQCNVAMDARYTWQQLQNSYWAMQTPSESAQAFVKEQQAKKRPSLFARFKSWLTGKEG